MTAPATNGIVKLIFFFSSRRRHTRWPRHWSSDVCSSDLVPGRFKDYIAMPKYNMYQSLHTTVIGPNGKPVEIQIRTHEMDRRAEFGVAAHWKYKDQGKSSKAVTTNTARSVKVSDAGEVDDAAWLRQLLDWQREVSDPDAFLDSLRYEVN